MERKRMSCTNVLSVKTHDTYGKSWKEYACFVETEMDRSLGSCDFRELQQVSVYFPTTVWRYSTPQYSQGQIQCKSVSIVKKCEHCRRETWFGSSAQPCTSSANFPCFLDTQFSHLTILFLRLSEMVYKMHFLPHV